MIGKRDVKAALQRCAGALVRWNGVVALNYHRLGDGRGSTLERGLFSATPEGFDEQLRWLAAHFDVISPGDLPYVLRLRRGRHAIVTFDDGYVDNHAVAYPILRARRLPATFFVSTGFIDRPRLPWWDRIAWLLRSHRDRELRPRHRDLPERLVYDEPDRAGAIRTVIEAYRALPLERAHEVLEAVEDATGLREETGLTEPLWMTWDMLREMRAGGMTIGGHTVNHEILSRMSREAQRQEILGCARRLEEELGISMRTFSYPSGGRDTFDEHTRACLREAGALTAFSYYGGFRRLGAWDAYDIPRLAVEQDTTFGIFRGEVLAPWSTEAGA